MKNITSKKFIGTVVLTASILSLAGWMYPGYYNMAVENDFIKSLKKKTSVYTEKLPEDRIYVQFDKPFYEPGETIWFSAFVRDGKNMKQSVKSDILHVDFMLGEEALGGIYKIKAYTNWQKNDGKDYGFEKEIQVQDIVLPNLKMK